MNNTNYVLFRIDFDNTENGVAEAIIKNVVAVFTQKSLLDAFLASHADDKTYRGHNQQIYPQYQHEEVLVDPLSAPPALTRLRNDIGPVRESAWKPSFSPDLESQPQKET